MRRIPFTTALLFACLAWPGGSSPAEEAERRASQLRGRAMLDRRTPVVGATVVVRPHEDPSRVYLTATGAGGEFRVGGLADGPYRVLLTRDGLEPLVKDGVTLRYPFRAVVEVTLRRAAADLAEQAAVPVARSDARVAGGGLRVAGRILGIGGRPQGEVYVRFVRDDGREDPALVRSDAGGTFLAPSLTGGAWRVEVDGAGFLPLRSVLELETDLELTVLLVPQPADYEPSPRELMPQERPIPPQGLGPAARAPF